MSDRVFEIFIDIVCDAVCSGFYVEWHGNVITITAPVEGMLNE